MKKRKWFGRWLTLPLVLAVFLGTMWAVPALKSAASTSAKYEFTFSKGNDFSIEILDQSEQTIAVLEKAEKSKVLSLEAGTYTYQASGAGYGTDAGEKEYNWGSGSFTVTKEGGSLTVRRMYMSVMNQDSIAFSISMTDMQGNTYQAGSTAGVARQYFTLPVSSQTTAYRYAFVPRNENYWGSHGVLYLQEGEGIYNWTSLCREDTNDYIIAEKTSMTVKVPSDVTVNLYRCPKMYCTRELIESSEQTEAEGYTTYTYIVPKNDTLRADFYRNGYIKLYKVLKSENSVTNYTLEESMWADLSENDVAQGEVNDGMLMNLDGSRYVEMKTGEQTDFCLYPYTYKNTDSFDGYLNPDYHVEILEGDSVKVLEADSYSPNTVSIQAKKAGVSILRISYDPIAIVKRSTLKEIFPGNGKDNAAIVVVNVDGSSTIQTGIELSEFDAIYYLASITDDTKTTQIPNAHGEYTFTPSAKGGIDQVQVHGTAGDHPWQTDSWKSYTPNADGSYTIELQHGKNVVRITSGKTERYFVIQSYALEAVIENGTAFATDEGIKIGTTAEKEVKISYNGLVMTLPRLNGIYNPGIKNIKPYVLGPAEFIYYEVEDERVEGVHVQYMLPKSNTITWTAPSQEGEYHFTGGRVSTTGFGSPAGDHQKIQKGSRYYQYHAGMIAPGFTQEYSYLPDLEFVVYEEELSGNLYQLAVVLPDSLPKGATFHIYSSRGGRQLPLSGKWHLAEETYTYAITCDGYLTAHGTFDVVAKEEEQVLDLSKTVLEPVPKQNGTVQVEIVGLNGNLVTGSAAIDSTKMVNLVKKRYTSYPCGGYTGLHALVQLLQDTDTKFTCKLGVLNPTDPVQTQEDGGWICEINGNFTEDYANTLVYDGDQIRFYHVQSGTTLAGRFEQELSVLSQNTTVSLTVMAKALKTNAEYEPLSGAVIYIDGKDSGNKTDRNGQVLLSSNAFSQPGYHQVTVVKVGSQGENQLSYTETTVYQRREPAVDRYQWNTENTQERLTLLAAYIRSMPAVSELTLSDAEKIHTMIQMEDALSDEEFKQFIQFENGTSFEFSENLYGQYEQMLSEKAMADVKEQITQIHKQKTITLSSEKLLKEARKAFDQLNDHEKEQLITYENWLYNAEKVLTQLKTMKVKLSTTSYYYDGKEKKPSVTVTYQSKTLKKDKDYTIRYYNNKAVGTGKVRITLTEKNGYTGVRDYTFKIKQSDAKVGTVYTSGNLKYRIVSMSKNKATGTASVVSGKSKTLTSITIPVTVTIKGCTVKVTEIEKNAWKDCNKLTKITVGSNVKTIGTSAFYNCTKLSSVKLGSNVATIGTKAFSKCTKLSSITLGKNVTTIHEQAFAGDKSLKTITIQSSKLKSVGKKAFDGIYSKAVIKVPSKKLESYKKLLKGKGQKSTVQIKKQ